MSPYKRRPSSGRIVRMSTSRATDESLHREVTARLADETLIDHSQIDADVKEGVVTLVGTVDSYAEKAVAQAIVLALPSVRDVVNAIDVRPTEERNPSDAELGEMVRRVLRWHALVPEQDVTVTVTDGVVTLGGTTHTAAQRDEADRAIELLTGVRDLVNEIEIAGPETPVALIRSAISEALQNRARHRVNLIEVAVDDRTVTLSGSAQSALEKRAVLGAVAHAPGVDKVLDHIAIDASR